MIHNSVLMRRSVAAGLAVLMFTAVLIWTAFSFMSSSVFLELRVAATLPRAQSFAVLADRFILGELDEETLSAVARVSDGGIGVSNAYVLITDMNGRNMFAVNEQAAVWRHEGINECIGQVLAGETVSKTGALRTSSQFGIIGVPVMHGETQTGALIMYIPSGEMSIARRILSRALIVSLCFGIPLAFIIVDAFVYRLVRPISQMSDIALSMAQGNFDKKANESIAGEMGMLGGALNRLSGELKKTISALTLERNRLVQIMDSLSDGIVAVDGTGTITHITKSIDNLFIHENGVSGCRKRVIPIESVWNAFDAAVKDGTSSDETVKYHGKDIRYIICPVYDDNHGIAGAVGTFNDVSREVMLENTRREYVANVSHEMRTPLTAMRGLIEPLKDGLVKDEATRQRYYDIIMRETLRLSRLINDIMELSRLQSGTTFIKREVFDPRGEIYDIAARYSALAEEHGLELITSDDIKQLPPVSFNQDRLEQILVILLDNAIKYTEKGSVTLSCCVCNEKVAIRVRDTGMGISAENLPHIFERFYKVDKAHSGMGSGLGLSIASEVLETMGESIRVCSEEGKGTEFTFTMKRAKNG